MKVILLDAIKGIGERGEIKKVADGYARNFLMPRGLVLPATKENQSQLSEILAVSARQGEKKNAAANELAEFINSHPVVLRRKSADGTKLFGSVSSRDIATAIAEKGTNIDHRQIELESPIKQPGHYTVKVRISSEVTTELTVTVEAEA